MTAKPKKSKSTKRNRLVSKQKASKYHYSIQEYRPRILSAQKLAKILKTSDRTIYKLAQQGKIPSMKLGGQWRFDLRQVLKQIQIRPKRQSRKKHIIKRGGKDGVRYRIKRKIT